MTYNDPHIPEVTPTRHYNHEMKSQELTKEYLGSQDAVLILTDHDAYDYDFMVDSAKLVVDTRNATKNVTAREKIRKL